MPPGIFLILRVSHPKDVFEVFGAPSSTPSFSNIFFQLVSDVEGHSKSGGSYVKLTISDGLERW